MPKIHTLYRTTRSILVPCLGQLLNRSRMKHPVYNQNLHKSSNHAHCLGQTCAKLYTLFRTARTKTILCPAAHPRIGHIREYPPPPRPGLVFPSTLGARDFSSAVSGFCQVFIVTRRSWLRSEYGRRCVGLRPTPKNSRSTREKALVPALVSGKTDHSFPYLELTFDTLRVLHNVAFLVVRIFCR